MKTKRFLFLGVGIAAMIAITATPVLADITTEVEVATGSGTPPIVKCKWEQDATTELEDGDADHSISGAQFNPPGEKCGLKTITYYAIVTDEEDMGDVDQVYVDVFHPAGSPPPYCCYDGPQAGGNPLFKYEVPMSKVTDQSTMLALLAAADDADLVTFQEITTGEYYDYDEIVSEKDSCAIWSGSMVIDYEQPAGDYTVKCFAIDHNSNLSPVLQNTFEYVATPLLEVDFSSINYGSCNLHQHKMVPGNLIWETDINGDPVPAGSGEAAKATIRNIGNTWASPSITQDDMGFGQDINGWNVSFDARMGNDDTYNVVYDPEETVTLSNYLDLSTLEELDFSILIDKGYSTEEYEGTMVIEAVEVAFSTYDCDGTGKPDALFGFEDPCIE